MTKTRLLSLLLLLSCTGVSVLWGLSLARGVRGGPIDFQCVYYGTRCLMQHHNPYSVSEMGDVYRAAGESGSIELNRIVTLYVNLPPTFLIVAPFAMLPVGAAQALWMLSTAGLLVLAACLMCDLGAKYAPTLSVCLIAFLLANCLTVFQSGNTAGIVIGLCVVAAWCLLRERFVTAGILCMAVSLAIKPHDAGLVWLFFLLAGGVHRKRALQALAITAMLLLASVLWVSHVAPDWMQDWHANMTTISTPGGLNDPLLSSVAGVVSLQTVFSVFRQDSHFYNTASYLVCGALLLVWAVTTLRSRMSEERAWLALGAIVPLTILITYHRLYDAKLMLLAVPACTVLWARGGPIRWIALVLNIAGVLLISEIPLVILEPLVQKLHLSTAVLSGRILTVVLNRPTPDILLILGIFYLWVYVRPIPTDTGKEWEGNTAKQFYPQVVEHSLSAK